MGENKGRFGHHVETVRDFLTEVREIGKEVHCSLAGFQMSLAPEALLERIEKALEFRVGADEDAVRAKVRLRELEEQVRAWQVRMGAEKIRLRDEGAKARGFSLSGGGSIPGGAVSGSLPAPLVCDMAFAPPFARLEALRHAVAVVGPNSEEGRCLRVAERFRHYLATGETEPKPDPERIAAGTKLIEEMAETILILAGDTESEFKDGVRESRVKAAREYLERFVEDPEGMLALLHEAFVGGPVGEAMTEG